MLNARGRVVAVEADGLWVETDPRSACAQCSAKHGCGERLLRQNGREVSCIKAFFSDGQNSTAWQLGDDVDIVIAEGAFLLAAVLAYGLPLLGLVLATSMAHSFHLGEFDTALAALLGLLVGGAIANLYSRIKSNTRLFNPSILSTH